MPQDGAPSHADPRETGSEFIDLLRRYVLQETLDPLKAAGRNLAVGAAAALIFGVASVLLLVGILRLLQSETGTAFRGDLSWLPYLITIGFGLIMLGGFGLLILRSAGRDRPAAPGGPS